MLRKISQKTSTPIFYVILLLASLTLWLGHSVATKRGIGINGGCPQTASPYLRQSKHHYSNAITYCSKGDRDQMELRSDDFPPGTARIDLEVAGYPNEAGLDVYLLTSSGQREQVKLPNAGETWRAADIFVPKSMRGDAFRLIVQDRSSNLKGWVGLGIKTYSTLAGDTRVISLALVGLCILHFLLLETSLIISRYASIEASSLYGLVTIGLASYSAFWLYFAARGLGIAFSYALLGVLVAHASVRVFRRTPQPGARQLHAAIVPVTSATGLLFVIAFFPYPLLWDTWQYAGSRWLTLPIDNWLPKIFADQAWAGNILHPMVGDWLSSDRPPLQTGFTLLLRPLSARPGWYQLASMWLQATALVPAAMLAARLGLSKVRRCVLMLLTTSALFLYNDVFVWPKLVAAAYCLIFYLALFCPDELQLEPRHARFLAGSSAALAMLSHGGAIFSLFGIYVVFACGSGRYKWRTLLATTVIGIALYSPWVAYQKLVDPPGSRLVAWHLAGEEQPTNKPITLALRAAYAKVTPSQWTRGRLTNLKTLFVGTRGFYGDAWRSVISHSKIDQTRMRQMSFRYFGYSMWFFSPLLWSLALLPSKRNENIVEERRLFAVLASGLALWCALIFVPGQTIIHQGAYANNIVAFILSCSIAFRISPWLFSVLAALNLYICADVFFNWTHPDAYGINTTSLFEASSICYWLALAIFVLIFVSGSSRTRYNDIQPAS